MSTKVVTAPASHAKRSVRSDKPAKQAAQQPAVNEDEASLANDDSEQEVSVAPAAEEKTASVESETSMAGEYTFGTALAEAAASSGSLISDAQRADEVGFGAFGDGDGSTPLLLAAIGLAAVGLIFIVKDGGGGNDVVVPVNKAPTITAPAAVTAAEDAANVALGKPTTADADVGDTVTVTATATNGTVTKAADGSFTFTPTANFNGTATITYSATDGKVAAPVTAAQTVTVTPVNDNPTITPPATVAAIDEDSAAGVTFAVTTADVDAGTTVTTSATVAAAQGTVTKNADGSFKFVPAANFNGTAAITVTANDGATPTAGTATTTVNITVNPVNDPATLSPLTATTAEDTALNLSDLITVTDIDGPAASITAAVSTQPQHGTITIVNGDLIYTPTADYNGSDSVGITLTDAGTPGSATSTFTVGINVTPVDENVTRTIDVPASGPAVTINVSDNDYILTDARGARTDVILTGFDSGDVIHVTGATESQYAFGTAGADPKDLRITFNNGTDFTQIVIDDILAGKQGFVFDYESAITVIGFDFLTFA